MLNTSTLRTLTMLGLLLGCGSAYATPLADEDHQIVSSYPDIGTNYGREVAISGDTLAVGAARQYVMSLDAGAVFVYRFDGSNWSEEAILFSDAPTNFAQFGKSVAIDGDTLVIGASTESDFGENSGSVYVFTRSGSTWTQQAKLHASDAAPGDIFGDIVAISGDKIVVGARGKDNFTGAAYVFKNTAGSWSEEKKLTAFDAAASDVYGIGVSIDNDTIAIGASNDQYSIGAAYVYQYDGADWNFETKLTPDNQNYNLFGNSVAVSGNRVVVGAHGANNLQGTAYVFVFDGSNWNQEAKLTASDAAVSNYFGYDVAFHNGQIAAGAYGVDSYTGATYVYALNGTAWDEIARLTTNDATANNFFGVTVAMHDDFIVAGATGANSNFGAVYSYNLPLSPSEPPPPAADLSEMIQLIIAANDTCISSGDLVEASRRGMSKWNNTLSSLQQNITSDNLVSACSDISTLLQSSNGSKRPKDWVKGNCVTAGNDPDLRNELRILQDEIGACQ